jgi:hypothetical protein
VKGFKQIIYFEFSQNHSKEFKLCFNVSNLAFIYFKSLWFKFEFLNQIPCFCFGKSFKLFLNSNYGLTLKISFDLNSKFFWFHSIYNTQKSIKLFPIPFSKFSLKSLPRPRPSRWPKSFLFSFGLDRPHQPPLALDHLPHPWPNLVQWRTSHVAQISPSRLVPYL